MKKLRSDLLLMRKDYRQPQSISRLLSSKLSSFRLKTTFDQRKHWEKLFLRNDFFVDVVAFRIVTTKNWPVGFGVFPLDVREGMGELMAQGI